MQRLTDSEKKEFEEFFLKYRKHFKQISKAVSRHKDISEDIEQNNAYRLIEHYFKHKDNVRNFKAFMGTFCFHTGRQHIRFFKDSERASNLKGKLWYEQEEMGDQQETLSDTIDAKTLVDQIKSKIPEILGKSETKVINAMMSGDTLKSREEVAKELGMTYNNVKQVTFQAFKKIRENFILE